MPLVLAMWLSVFAQERAEAGHAFGPPVSVQNGGLTINYRTQGEIATGPVIDLDPWTAFLACFKGPGVSGNEFVDGRPVLQADGYVYWVHRQTIENAAEVLVCQDWDTNRDYDVDLADLQSAQHWIPRLKGER